MTKLRAKRMADARHVFVQSNFNRRMRSTRCSRARIQTRLAWGARREMRLPPLPARGFRSAISVYEHLAKCSPCYQEFRRIQQSLGKVATRVSLTTQTLARRCRGSRSPRNRRCLDAALIRELHLARFVARRGQNRQPPRSRYRLICGITRSAEPTNRAAPCSRCLSCGAN